MTNSFGFEIKVKPKKNFLKFSFRIITINLSKTGLLAKRPLFSLLSQQM